MAVCAVLSDCDTVEDIAEWAAVKEPWLRRFLVLPNGVPSQDTFLRIFRLIDPKQFEAAFRRWVGGIVTALGGQIAIDGKSLRGSADSAQAPVHIGETGNRYDACDMLCLSRPACTAYPT